MAPHFKRGRRRWCPAGTPAGTPADGPSPEGEATSTCAEEVALLGSCCRLCAWRLALLAWMMLVGLDSAELLEEGVGGRGAASTPRPHCSFCGSDGSNSRLSSHAPRPRFMYAARG